MNQFEKSSPPKMRLTMGMMRSLTSESTILPKAAPMPSDVRGQAEDISPPVPAHALTEAVVEAIRPTQPRLADQLARKVAETERREAWVERKQARERREHDRPAAA